MMAPTIASIQRAVADRQHIGVRALKGRRGKPKIVRARHAAMYLSRRLTRHSYTTIGRHFGGRHHTSVLHGCRQVQGRVFRNSKSRAAISRLIDELTSTEIAPTVDNRHFRTFVQQQAVA